MGVISVARNCGAAGKRGGAGCEVGDGGPAGILAVAVVERSELADIGGAAGTAEAGRIGLDVESWVERIGAGGATVAIHAARQGGVFVHTARGGDIAGGGLEGQSAAVQVEVEILGHPALVIGKFGDPVGFAVALIDELLGFFELGVGADVGGHFLHVDEVGEGGELDWVSDNGEGESGVIVAGGDAEAGLETKTEGVSVTGANFTRGGSGENRLVAGGGDAGVIRVGGRGGGAEVVAVGVRGEVF